MASAAALAPFIAQDPRNFAELELLCRDIVDAWVCAGGSAEDELIQGFHFINAEAAVVGTCGRDPEVDGADFYRVFYPVFTYDCSAACEQIKSGVSIH